MPLDSSFASEVLTARLLMGAVPLALLLGGAFTVMCLIAALKGQWDDTDTPQHRILKDDNEERQ